MSVKLRYVELEPDKIFNWLAPKNITCWNAFPEWHRTWWEPETVAKRELFGEYFMKEFDLITGHFSKLEKSILKDGMHHPISVVTGPPRNMYLAEPMDINHFPPETHGSLKDVIYSHTFGGSRLTVAQKHSILVPCVVHDFSNLFPNNQEINAHNYKTWFGNNYTFTNATPRLRLRLHSHLMSGQYNGMNGATRNAQANARRLATERINEA